MARESRAAISTTLFLKSPTPKNMKRRYCRFGGRSRACGILIASDKDALVHLGHDGRCQAVGQDLRSGHVILRLRGDRDPVPGRHRRHEHHAGFGHRAHARNRHTQSNGRNQARHPAAVLCRIRHADGRERILGLTFGMGTCVALQALPLPDFVPHPIVSPISIILSIFTLSFITVTAGMYPAQRAADMTPVESLRYE